MGLKFEQITSFGSDSASVMNGRHAGIATLLRSKNNQMIAVHCICYRLALATAQASNESSYLKKMEDHLFVLWNYFHHSSVRSAESKQVQELTQIFILVKAVDTH